MECVVFVCRGKGFFCLDCGAGWGWGVNAKSQEMSFKVLIITSLHPPPTDGRCNPPCLIALDILRARLNPRMRNLQQNREGEISLSPSYMESAGDSAPRKSSSLGICQGHRAVRVEGLCHHTSSRASSSDSLQHNFMTCFTRVSPSTTVWGDRTPMDGFYFLALWGL